MSALHRITPFRQIARAYTNLRALAREKREIFQKSIHSSSDSMIAPQHVKSITASMESATHGIKELLSVPTITSQHVDSNTSIDSATQAMRDLVAPSSKEVDIYKRLGFQFILDRTSLVDRCVIEGGSWEPEQVSFFTRLAECFRGQTNNIFLDVGSYWGLYSFMFLNTRIFERIYAFEADGHNFAQLQANVFLNRAAREITAFHKAVSAKGGVMHVWDSLSHPDGNRGGVGMVHEGFHLPTSRVEGLSIDSFLALSGANLAIKLDVEGHEQHALQGMEKTVRENRVIMQVEVYEPQQDVTFPLLEQMGLRRIHQIDHDFYYTNIGKDLIGY